MNQAYEALVNGLGENPLAADSACALAEEINQSDIEQQAAFIEQATAKSIECAELLHQAMKMSKQKVDTDDMEEDKDASETLLLEDLVVKVDDMKNLAKSYASSGIVRKGHAVSKRLLEEADACLEKEKSKTKDLSEAQESGFHDKYMEMFTSAFGEELNKFREENDFGSEDVSFLIDSIQAGANVFQPLEKAVFAMSREES